MMDKNLFVYVSSLLKACSFTVFCQKKCHTYKKKTQRKERKKGVNAMNGKNDTSGPGSLSFLSKSSMYYITLTLHNPINQVNIISTNSFSWASSFTSLTTWCTNDLRRLQLVRINNLDTEFSCSSFQFVKRKEIMLFSFEFRN